MPICLSHVGAKLRMPVSCCYGGQGCTAAHSANGKETSQSGPRQEQSSTGSDQRQESGSEPMSPSLRVDLSSESSLQDLYLIAQALSEGGFELSVTVQATPSKQSAPSPLDIRGLCGFSTRECPFIGSHQYWDAAIARLRSTTPSSKQSGSYNIECSVVDDQCIGDICSQWDECIGKDEEPSNRRY